MFIHSIFTSNNSSVDSFEKLDLNKAFKNTQNIIIATQAEIDQYQFLITQHQKFINSLQTTIQDLEKANKKNEINILKRSIQSFQNMINEYEVKITINQEKNTQMQKTLQNIGNAIQNPQKEEEEEEEEKFEEPQEEQKGNDSNTLNDSKDFYYNTGQSSIFSKHEIGENTADLKSVSNYLKNFQQNIIGLIKFCDLYNQNNNFMIFQCIDLIYTDLCNKKFTTPEMKILLLFITTTRDFLFGCINTDEKILKDLEGTHYADINMEYFLNPESKDKDFFTSLIEKFAAEQTKEDIRQFLLNTALFFANQPHLLKENEIHEVIKTFMDQVKNEKINLKDFNNTFGLTILKMLENDFSNILYNDEQDISNIQLKPYYLCFLNNVCQESTDLKTEEEMEEYKNLLEAILSETIQNIKNNKNI